MAVSLEEIQNSVQTILRENRILNLATHGIRIWNASLYYWNDGFDILCVVKESQTLENICSSPRVSFSINNSESKYSLQGNGIARIIEDTEEHCLLSSIKTPQIHSFVRKYSGKIVKISPYRFSVTDKEFKAMIEKRKLEWKIVESAPVSSALPAGIVNQLRFWLKAARAVSFPLSVLPVCLGTALAFVEGAFNPWFFLLALLGGVLVHAGANLISDYYDFKKGVDTTDALSSHPGALVNERIEPERILIAAFLTFLAATLVGALLLIIVGLPVLFFGIVGLMGGYFYTGGSISYKYKGLGELFITFLMGPLMVMGAYFVQTQEIRILPFLISLPIGLLVGSVSLVNNLRDVLDDQRAGIVTLPMQLGIRTTKYVYYAMTFLPYLIIGGIVLLKYPFYPMLLVVFSLPMAFKAVAAVRSTEDSAEDIQAKAQHLPFPLNSIKLHLQFSVFLLIGTLLTAIITTLNS